MRTIIHETYEILEEIGSGGGGIVYLAEHLNLHKKVVLKADRRKPSANDSLLRREADILKNLSHTYIPQVYDYFVEDGTVYTVIDYVEGESLDLPLKRGERFSQAQVIAWAKQLLQALAYLHKMEHGDPPKGYVHSDIKPANLMKRPNGEICLIDFNIAVAFGEELTVGYSVGYASPEHYGIDYSSGGYDSTRTNSRNATQPPSDRRFSGFLSLHGNRSTGTVIEEQIPDYVPEPSGSAPSTEQIRNAETIPLSPERTDDAAAGTVPEPPSERKSDLRLPDSTRKLIPDVRSDIYMVGATLYHLLSGTRPAKDAADVVPLSKSEFSPLLVDIISKSMCPNPDLRYQTANEMYEAFCRLFEDDPRILRHKKRTRVGFAGFGVLILTGVCLSLTGMFRLRNIQKWEKRTAESEAAYQAGDAVSAVRIAAQAIPEHTGLLTPQPLAETQLALTNGMGVYDLSTGYKVWKTLQLPSAMLHLAISPDGKKALCLYAYSAAVVDLERAEILATLPLEPSALSEAAFLDSDTVVYAGADGISCYQISTASELWRGGKATGLAVSADAGTVAAVYREDSAACIYDARTGKLRNRLDFDGRHLFVSVNDSFADPQDNIFALNEDGSLLAASFSDGTVTFFETDTDKTAELPVPDGTYCHFEGGFYQHYFGYAGKTTEGVSTVSVLDLNTQTEIFSQQSLEPLSIAVDPDGFLLIQDSVLNSMDLSAAKPVPLARFPISIRRFTGTRGWKLFSSESALCFYDRETGRSSLLPCTERPDFLAISGNYAVIGSMNSPSVRLMRFQDQSDAVAFRYERGEPHLEARVSQDYQTVMLFSNLCFSIYDSTGKQLAFQELPDAEQIYDTQFRRDANRSWLEVSYYDGTVRNYDAHSGLLLETVQDGAKDSPAYEELVTASYRIANPLHGTVSVYHAKSGKHLCDLEENASLLYAEETGSYLVLQYLTADLNYYGVLLNANLERIADLPNLCDIIDGQLVFDDPAGYISICPIYDINTLNQMFRKDEVK